MRKRILIVDDDPNIRNLLRMPLSDAGYDVVEQENGLLASRWFVENRADLLILDVVMPEMDGIQFAYEMKQRRPEMPILAISAGEHIMSREFCLKFMKSLGAVEAFPKPFDLDLLLKRVKEMLARTDASARN